jgi:hypothetical protein
MKTFNTLVTLSVFGESMIYVATLALIKITELM